MTKKLETATLGVDIGNCFVKTSVGIAFPSKTSTYIGLDNDNRVIYDGQEMLIGDGEYETDLNKSTKDNILPLLFEAIRRSTSADSVRVVVGLPVAQYKSNKDKMESLIRENSTKRIGGRTITIEDVKIVPEGATVIYNLNKTDKDKIGNRDLIVCDIGGRTTDICLQKVVNGKRATIESDTLYNGIFNIYSDIIKYIKEKYVADYKLEDAEDIINNGLFINGEEVDTTFIKEIVVKHFREIIKDINIKFNLSNGYIYLTGGGSKIYKNLFLKFKNTIVSENAFMDNAKSYAKVGEALWERK